MFIFKLFLLVFASLTLLEIPYYSSTFFVFFRSPIESFLLIFFLSASAEVGILLFLLLLITFDT